MNSSRFDYCVVGPCSLPEHSAGSDIDIVVLDKDVIAVSKLLAESLWDLGAPVIQLFMYHKGFRIDTLVESTSHVPARLMLDVSGSLSNGFHELVPATAMLWARKYNSWERESTVGHYSPSPADDFIYYFLKRLSRQSLNPDQFKHLQAQWIADPAAAESRLAKFLSHKNYKRFARIFATSNREALADQMKILKRAVTPAFAYRTSIIARIFRGLIHRMMCPIGFELLIVVGERPDSGEWMHQFCQHFPALFEQIIVLDEASSRHRTTTTRTPLGSIYDLSHRTEVRAKFLDNPVTRALWLRLQLRRNVLIVRTCADTGVLGDLGTATGATSDKVDINKSKTLRSANAIVLCADVPRQTEVGCQHTASQIDNIQHANNRHYGRKVTVAITRPELSSLVRVAFEVIVQSMNRRARETYENMWG